MIDRKKMIIWAKPKEITLEEQVNYTYEILNKVKEYKLFTSLFLSAKSKKDIKEFELTKENVKKNILKKRDKKFPNLGSELLFFTSLEDDESLSISISVGKYNTSLNNTMVIALPINITLEKSIECIDLLKDLVKLYNAYYACITSNKNIRIYDDWYNYNDDVPKVIFWMNYWGNNIVNRLSINKIENKGLKCDRIDNGYYVRLQEEPVDTEDSTQLNRQKELSCLL